MAEVPFTQFLMPDGRRVPVVIDRPAEVAVKARSLLTLGYRLECEVLQTGQVSFTVERDGPDGEAEVLAHEIAVNGPPVVEAIDRLITNAWTRRMPK